MNSKQKNVVNHNQNHHKDKIVNTSPRQVYLKALIALGVHLSVQVCALAAEPPKDLPPSDWDKLVGQPADLSAWAYAWRADRKVQEKPEAYFILRRLERLDKVYRPLFEADAKKKGKDSLAAPKGRLLSALLLLNSANVRVELRWPETEETIPPQEAVEVRAYRSSYGWFGVQHDEVLTQPEVSQDRRTWSYLNKDPKTGKPRPGPVAYTDMVAVFLDETKATAGVKYACPSIRLISTSTWKRIDVEIEWGFQGGSEKAVFDGRIEDYVGMVGSISPLADDPGTTMTGPRQWRSSAAGGNRRGIAVSLLYLARSSKGPYCSPLDSRVTLWTKGGNFTFLTDEVNRGPILMPERGVYVSKVGSGKTARQFAEELARKHVKPITQIVREHREIASWEELMRKMRVPPDGELPPLNPLKVVGDPPMHVQLSDIRWTDAWRTGTEIFRKGYGCSWAGLALEAGYPLHVMGLVGLSDCADKKLQYWLKAPGAKADGAFVDGEGSFEYAKSMRNDIGMSHDGTHPSTGRILFALADQYLLTGDKAWFQKNQERMRRAADWIIRQRNLYLKDIPNRTNLVVGGFQPPQGLTDIALGRCYWRWFLNHDADALKGLRRFAEALADIDPALAKPYLEEADAYRRDILRAVEREMALSPVRPVRNGTYRTYIPVTVYSRGSMVTEMGSFAHHLVDTTMGALPLADTYGVLDPRDDRLTGHLEVVEERMPCGRRIRGKNETTDPEEDLFWGGYAEVVKYSYVSTIYLLRDDIPCFLRHWMYNYAWYVAWNGVMLEWSDGKPYDQNAKKEHGGDWMNTAWFMENFRNLLVMEDRQSLWLARATPRAWLQQGKKIGVKNAPTYFGTVDYEIVSDVDNGKITATVTIPSRKPPKVVWLRLRHPKAVPIKSVTVNGQPSTAFDKDKETITLKGLTATVAVTAQY